MTAPRSTGPVDIGALLDHGPWPRFQQMVVVFAALALLMDGFDVQLIAFAIPSMMQEWGVTRGDFAPVVAAGLFGMTVGTMIAGFLADRFGRRIVLVAAVLLFGVATLAIGFADGLLSVAVLRFIAGLGIGGALPPSSTLAAEFTPVRHRAAAVSISIVCIPAGGMLAGLFAAWVLPEFGWRALFWLGGALAMLLAAVLYRWLPESPRYLLRRPARRAELLALLARTGRVIDPSTELQDARDAAADASKSRGLPALFARVHLRDTLALWAAFFLSLLIVYTAFSWLPTMLNAEGRSVSVAASGLTAFNIGCVIGTLMMAPTIGRFGTRWPMLFGCAGLAGTALLLRGADFGDNFVLAFGLGMAGLFIGFVQSPLWALCAHIYPTRIRATGTAGASAFGRVGAIVSSFTGAAVITAGGATAYFGLIAVASLAMLVAVALIRNHVPKTRQPAGAEAT